MKKHNILNQEFPCLKSQKEVKNIIDIILQKGAEILYDKYLVDKWPEYLSEDIMHWNNGIIGQKNIIVDKGENKIQLQHKWALDNEPTPLKLDNFGRCAVKTEVKAITEAPDHDQEDTKSLQSMTSYGDQSMRTTKNSAKFSTLSISKMSFLGKSSKFKNSLVTKNMSQFVNNNNKEEEKSGASSKPNLQVEQEYKLIKTREDSDPPTPDPITDKLRENREKKDKEKVQKQKIQQKKDQEEAEGKAKKIEMQKQLKHKNVTYDTDGTYIFIKQKPIHSIGQEQALPQDGFGLEFKNPNKKIGDVQRLPNIKENAKIQNVNEIKNFKNIKKNEIDKKQAEPAPTLEFHNQPKLSEFLSPKTGVSIKFQNGIQKDGGIIEYENKMRKEDYVQLIESQPNRPIPQYLQQEQYLEVPKASDFENKMKQKLERFKNQKKRPQTAGNYYQLQGVQIEEQDLYIEMMADEPIQMKASQISRISQKKNRSSFADIQGKDFNNNNQQSQIEQKNLDNKKRRPQTSQAQNKVQQYKKRQFGPKGEEVIPFDLGVSYGRDSQQNPKGSRIQESVSDYNDSKSKIRRKLDKFDQNIRDAKNWGSVESEFDAFNSKIKHQPQSFSNIKKPQSAKLYSSQKKLTQQSQILNKVNEIEAKVTNNFMINNNSSSFFKNQSQLQKKKLGGQGQAGDRSTSQFEKNRIQSAKK